MLKREKYEILALKKFFWYQLGVRNEVLVNQFRLLQKNFFRADSKVHASFLGKMALKIPMPERKKDFVIIIFLIAINIQYHSVVSCTN